MPREASEGSEASSGDIGCVADGENALLSTKQKIALSKDMRKPG